MEKTIIDIVNKNVKNNPKEKIYKSFNEFIFSEDTKILGKLLHRFEKGVWRYQYLNF